MVTIVVARNDREKTSAVAKVLSGKTVGFFGADVHPNRIKRIMSENGADSAVVQDVSDLNVDSFLQSIGFESIKFDLVITVKEWPCQELKKSFKNREDVNFIYG
jgi:hypothetical protein